MKAVSALTLSFVAVSYLVGSSSRVWIVQHFLSLFRRAVDDFAICEKISY